MWHWTRSFTVVPTVTQPPFVHHDKLHKQDHRSQTSSWLLDTGANSHVAPDLSGFEDSEPYHGKDSLFVGNGISLPILHIASTTFESPNKTLSINKILHVPEIKRNLLSVQRVFVKTIMYSLNFMLPFFV